MKKNNQKRWRAVYTKPRGEKKIADRLTASGIEVYCPMQTVLRQWSDRKKKVSVPIFPSYVFVKISDSESLEVLQDPGVMNFVYWLGQPAVIPGEEIKAIQVFLNTHSSSTVSIEIFTKGDDVAIKDGPFKGYSGKVRESRKGKISLTISSLGLTMKVELSAGVMEKTND